MLYEILGRVRSTGGKVACITFPVHSGAPPNATVVVTDSKEAWISWVGGTEFSQDAGDAAHDFSFKGPDPHAAVLALLSGSVSTASYSTLRAEHFADIKQALGAFSLDLGQKADLGTSTDALIEAYQIDTGNPYLEVCLLSPSDEPMLIL
jgi:alpha-L-fucosidase 2